MLRPSRHTPGLMPIQPSVTESMPSNAALGPKAARAAVFTFLSQWVRLIIRLVSLAVLSRLLEPSDFGIFAMATAFTGVVTLLAETGFANASIRARTLDAAEASTAFWGNLIVAIGLSGCCWVVSPLVANFFEEPRLSVVIRVLSISLPLSALAAQHSAILQRDLRFGQLVVSEVLAQSVGVAIAIGLAIYGGNYWALVGQQLATAGFTAVALWMIASWRPGFPRFTPGARSLLITGAHLSLVEVLNYGKSIVDQILVGRYTDATSLGEYSRAITLLSLPITQLFAPLNRVAIPTLSKLQDEPAHFTRTFRRMLVLVAVTSAPLLAVLVACPDEVVAIMLGPRFANSAPLLRLLAIASWGAPTTTATFWILIALGRSRRLIIILSIQFVLLLVALRIGVLWGTTGVAAAYAVTAQAIRMPTILFALHGGPVSPKHYVDSTWPSAVVAVLGGVAMWVVARAMMPMGAWASLSASLATGAIVMAILCVAIPAAREQIWAIASLHRLLARGRIAVPS